MADDATITLSATVPAVATIVSDALRAIGLEFSKSKIVSAAILFVVTIGISLEEITALAVRVTADAFKL